MTTAAMGPEPLVIDESAFSFGREMANLFFDVVIKLNCRGAFALNSNLPFKTLLPMVPAAGLEPARPFRASRF